MKIATPHPVTQILTWIGMAYVVQIMQSLYLPILVGAIALIAYLIHPTRMLTLLRRTKWILVSILIIYAFMSPGKAIWSSPYLLSPSQEGVVDGLMQLTRIIGVLAGLSILLTSLTQERLISGIYVLVFPLQLFGISRERIAVRMALTLQYAEKAMQETAKDWRASIDQAMNHEVENRIEITIPKTLLTWFDMIIFIVMVLIIIGLER